MNIKSTKTKNFKINWDFLDYFPIDKLTFVFSLLVGAFIGLLTMGFGHTGPIITIMILTVVIGGFGAIDSGQKGFIYVLRFGIYIYNHNVKLNYIISKFNNAPREKNK